MLQWGAAPAWPLCGEHDADLRLPAELPWGQLLLVAVVQSPVLGTGRSAFLILFLWGREPIFCLRN